MNTINLPVTVKRDRGVWVNIVESSGEILVEGIARESAEEIAIALNSHDALVKASDSLKALITHRQYGNSFEIIWAHARVALAKVNKEKANNRLEDSKRYPGLYCGDLPPGA